MYFSSLSSALINLNCEQRNREQQHFKHEFVTVVELLFKINRLCVHENSFWPLFYAEVKRNNKRNMLKKIADKKFMYANEGATATYVVYAINQFCSTRLHAACVYSGAFWFNLQVEWAEQIWVFRDFFRGWKRLKKLWVMESDVSCGDF